jgi:hypothetical protein
LILAFHYLNNTRDGSEASVLESRVQNPIDLRFKNRVLRRIFGSEGGTGERLEKTA